MVRDALVANRTATLDRGKHLRRALAKRVNRERLAQIERQLKRIDAEIQKLLRSEETLIRSSEILTSIPGISSVTAAGLIVHMPELGTNDRPPPSDPALRAQPLQVPHLDLHCAPSGGAPRRTKHLGGAPVSDGGAGPPSGAETRQVES